MQSVVNPRFFMMLWSFLKYAQIEPDEKAGVFDLVHVPLPVRRRVRDLLGAGAAVRIGFSGMGIIEPIQVLALQLVPRNEPLGEYREGKPVVKAEVHGNPQP